MKATLIRMGLDSNSLHFRCEGGPGEHHEMHFEVKLGTGPHIYEFTSTDGVEVHKWSEGNANPARHAQNTITLAAIRKKPAYAAAIAAIDRRMHELGAQYELDHSMYAARCEIYEDKLQRTLRALQIAIENDRGGTDESGNIAQAAEAYSKAFDAEPKSPDNPWARSSRERRDERKLALQELTDAERTRRS